MNRTLSFLFAAALGALLGSLTALELAPILGVSGVFAAIIGIVVGGLTGYVVVDFRAFLNGSKSAGKRAFSAPGKIWGSYASTSREFKLSAIYMPLFAFWLMGYAWLASTLDSGITSEALAWLPFYLLGGPLLGIFFHVMWFLADNDREDSARFARGGAYWLSPVGILHFVFLKALPWLADMLWYLGESLVTFLHTLFLIVHSERRALCCIDAMLGTLIGYYAGSWLIGAVAGLALGGVSYEVISKRWLKVAD